MIQNIDQHVTAVQFHLLYNASPIGGAIKKPSCIYVKPIITQSCRWQIYYTGPVQGYLFICVEKFFDLKEKFHLETQYCANVHLPYCQHKSRQ